jgi:hypothetical protein
VRAELEAARFGELEIIPESVAAEIETDEMEPIEGSEEGTE